MVDTYRVAVITVEEDIMCIPTVAEENVAGDRCEVGGVCVGLHMEAGVVGAVDAVVVVEGVIDHMTVFDSHFRERPHQTYF